MAIPLRGVGGTFYRAVLADRVERVLDPPGPERAGRYHRPGQRALYLTPEADWAAIAVGGYQAEEGLERLIVPLELDDAQVFDQHDEAACLELGIDRELGDASVSLSGISAPGRVGQSDPAFSSSASPTGHGRAPRRW